MLLYPTRIGEDHFFGRGCLDLFTEQHNESIDRNNQPQRPDQEVPAPRSLHNGARHGTARHGRCSGWRAGPAFRVVLGRAHASLGYQRHGRDPCCRARGWRVVGRRVPDWSPGPVKGGKAADRAATHSCKHTRRHAVWQGCGHSSHAASLVSTMTAALLHAYPAPRARRRVLRPPAAGRRRV